MTATPRRRRSSAGVDWVVRHADELDIDVLTIAFDSGSTTTHDPVADAVARAWEAGIVVVAAAGNGGADAVGLRLAGQRWAT